MSFLFFKKCFYFLMSLLISLLEKMFHLLPPPRATLHLKLQFIGGSRIDLLFIPQMARGPQREKKAQFGVQHRITDEGTDNRHYLGVGGRGHRAKVTPISYSKCTELNHRVAAGPPELRGVPGLHQR